MRDKFGRFMKGHKVGMMNKHHSKRSKQKMSIGHKGKHHSPKTEFKKGVKFSKKFRQKMSMATKGSKSHRWKGGRWYNNKGYILIHKPNHPFCDNRGYVFEHRFVMEKMLNRYLKPFPMEIVHHKNGIKDDNKPKNLVLVVGNKNWHPKTCPKCRFKFLVR